MLLQSLATLRTLARAQPKPSDEPMPFARPCDTYQSASKRRPLHRGEFRARQAPRPRAARSRKNHMLRTSTPSLDTPLGDDSGSKPLEAVLPSPSSDDPAWRVARESLRQRLQGVMDAKRSDLEGGDVALPRPRPDVLGNCRQDEEAREGERQRASAASGEVETRPRRASRTVPGCVGRPLPRYSAGTASACASANWWRGRHAVAGAVCASPKR